MTASIRCCSTFGLCLFVLFTGSLAFAQAGGAAGEGAGGAAGAEPDGAAGEGEGGAPAVGTGTRLGRACLVDQDCQDADTPDLECVTATETVLGDGAPPKGLCTSPCESNVDCSALSAGALCYPFNGSVGTSYCVEGCAFGEAPLGDVKCHGREEFACLPALLSDTAMPCATNASCGSGELCVDGTCAVVFPACTPSCRGDLDCAENMYCDQSFLSGVCVPQKPVGKGLGEACTVENEPDECLGFCQADVAGGTQGHCSTTCGLGTPCSWNATSERFDGACFYGSVLTSETASVGDFGFCTPSCNCNDECGDPTLECQLLPVGRLTDEFRGPGLCFSEDPQVTALDECTQGGSGGEPSGAGGSGGSRNPSTGGTSRGGTSNAGDANDPGEGGETAKPGGGTGDSSGCGCKLTPQRRSNSSAVWLLALVGLLFRRRRAN